MILGIPCGMCQTQDATVIQPAAGQICRVYACVWSMAFWFLKGRKALAYDVCSTIQSKVYLGLVHKRTSLCEIWRLTMTHHRSKFEHGASRNRDCCSSLRSFSRSLRLCFDNCAAYLLKPMLFYTHTHSLKMYTVIKVTLLSNTTTMCNLWFLKIPFSKRV